MLGTEVNTVLSSAYNEYLNKLEQIGRSLMYNKKRSDHNIDPWGTSNDKPFSRNEAPLILGTLGTFREVGFQ